LRTGKPVGFTEFGPHGTANPPGDYDYRRLLQGIVTNFPQVCYFLAWDDKWCPAANRFAREFYSDPRIVSRADLPSGLIGIP
jgi:mannan endo-1,4-beta-mannosidase